MQAEYTVFCPPPAVVATAIKTGLDSTLSGTRLYHEQE